MKKIIKVANAVVLNKDGSLLLLKRSKNLKQPNFYGLPGGIVENNETPQETIKRELQEETGILNSQFILKDAKKFKIEKSDEAVEITTFLINLLSDDVKINLDPFEHSDYQWVPPIEISQVDKLLPGIPTMIKDLLNLDESTKASLS